MGSKIGKNRSLEAAIASQQTRILCTDSGLMEPYKGHIAGILPDHEVVMGSIGVTDSHTSKYHFQLQFPVVR